MTDVAQTAYDDVFDVVFAANHSSGRSSVYSIEFGYACGDGSPTPARLTFATQAAFWKARGAWAHIHAQRCDRIRLIAAQSDSSGHASCITFEQRT